MRFIIGTGFGLLVAAIVNTIGLDACISALRTAERLTQTAVHEASKAAAKATEGDRGR